MNQSYNRYCKKCKTALPMNKASPEVSLLFS